MTYDDLPDKLYFINIPLEDNETENNEILVNLKPRIPHNILFGENIEIPRVCLSSSIWGCIDGIGCQRILDTLDKYATDRVGVPFHIYEIQIDKLDKEELITPTELFLTNRVQDAWITQEYWYLNEIKLDPPIIIEVVGINWGYSGVFSMSKRLIDKYLKENNIQQHEFNTNIYDDIVNAVYDEVLEDSKPPMEIYPAIQIDSIDGTTIERGNIDYLYDIPPMQITHPTDSTTQCTGIKSLSF